MGLHARLGGVHAFIPAFDPWNSLAQVKEMEAAGDPLSPLLHRPTTSG